MGVRMSHDGQRLFTASRAIHRFRLEGEDLVYEQSSKDLVSGHTTHFALSVDSKWVAIPTGGGNSSGYNIFVFDASDFQQYKLDRTTAHTPAPSAGIPRPVTSTRQITPN